MQPKRSLKRNRTEKKSQNGAGNKKRKTTQSEIAPETTPDFVESYREKHLLQISEPSFLPYETFSEPGFEPRLLQPCNFEKPTPIQSQTWPVILAGRDVVGIAQTGSGKTLAFGLPVLQKIFEDKFYHEKLPLALVLSPTRELAMQTYDTLSKCGKTCSIDCHVVFGGVNKVPQRDKLKYGVKILVATPGRLLDFMSEESVSLRNIRYLVIDEADRLLDMGFEHDVERIIAQTPDTRQTLMFSATWLPGVQQLASKFLKKPVEVSVGNLDLKANSSITQIVEVIDPQQKDNRLIPLLRKYHNANRTNRILLFVLYKKEAVRVESFLKSRGFRVQSIHGDKPQVQRTQVLELFKKGTEPLLVATDVAARGLDVPDIDVVINYTFPLLIEDYVHRIGRTGRAGKKGVSHTLFTVYDKAHAGELVNILKKNNQVVPEDLLKFGIAIKRKDPKIGKIDIDSTPNNHIVFESDDDEE